MHGGPQQGWVQSQTTFASLGKGDEGEWEVRVLKQKIWVDGISYELQACSCTPGAICVLLLRTSVRLDAACHIVRRSCAT